MDQNRRRAWRSLVTGWIAGGVAAVGLTATGAGSRAGPVLAFAACFALAGAAAASAWLVLGPDAGQKKTPGR